ncbi:hypothetical protein B1B04_02770 [Lysinibacillus sp. KCTC 33748]|uniref:hypothetical protein n=1 Tax=unclassified Lysinibacillus TaxID=2636778 RepID=UPI0009A8822D|nr:MULTISPECIES: hypothetical protein [unclassified Lysinibacillus]OXS75938.1 hypothetical protein B1B04_02770 [Lysinibacillus sp. KCTC 33748]SKB36834.1 hypothetical protein SAMN06295926_1027 [Lysinibacillus sp. AC-3]
MKKLFYVGALSALLLSACGEETATVTPDEFKKLENGMSPDEVKEIVGGKSKNPDAKEDDDLYLFLEYDGENGVDKESTVSLSFKDGKLTGISENGLMKEKIKFTKEQEEQIAENVANAISKSSADPIDEYETTLKQIITKTKGNSNISMKDKEIIEAGKYSIELTSDIFIFVDVNKENNIEKISAAVSSNALSTQNKEVKIAFEALLQSADKTLSTQQQSAIMEKLGFTSDGKLVDHTEVYTLNNVTYAYHSSIENDSAILQAKLK